ITSNDPPCPNPAPLLGECGGTDQLVVLTSIFGASVDPILGDTENTNFRVSAGIPDNAPVAPQTFTQFSVGDRTFGTGQYEPPTLVMTIHELVDDKAEVLNATKVGTTFARPLEAILYLVEDNYRFEQTGSGCGPAPASPCYKLTSLETRRVRPVNNGASRPVRFENGTPDGVTVDAKYEVAGVGFTPLFPVAGLATTTAVQHPGNGRHSTLLTVAPFPWRNQVLSQATATVWVPYLDVYSGV